MVSTYLTVLYAESNSVNPNQGSMVHYNVTDEIFRMYEHLQVFSIRLLRSEKLRLIRAIIFQSFTSLQIGIYLLSDYSIYRTLLLIRGEGENSQYSTDVSSDIDIEGSGAIADLYNHMRTSFKPDVPNFAFDPILCLPEPLVPDMARYIQIGKRR